MTDAYYFNSFPARAYRLRGALPEEAKGRTGAWTISSKDGERITFVSDALPRDNDPDLAAYKWELIDKAQMREVADVPAEVAKGLPVRKTLQSILDRLPRLTSAELDEVAAAVAVLQTTWLSA